jgi:hypothetical protein
MIPKFTAEYDPTHVSYHGLVGEANRRKLAETFHRPTTWKDYCEIVSKSNCPIPDEVARRPPALEEQERMFFPEEYTGHFCPTEKNDCDANPHTCTGESNAWPVPGLVLLLPVPC